MTIDGSHLDLEATELPDAVVAFDRVAREFDERFGDWASVEAQRRAVRRYLLEVFPRGNLLLELGGGTGTDAIFLARRGRRVMLTDGSPQMVERARSKMEQVGLLDRVDCRVATLEELDGFADGLRPDTSFDGAYSNFASLNCVADLQPVADGLARLLRPAASAMLVVFGPWSIGEIVLSLGRGSVSTAFRRFTSQPVAARLGGHDFRVRYWRPWHLSRVFQPYFRLRRIRGIGILVPPSAAEPGISRFPRTVRILEAIDRVLCAPCALLGDHVLLHLERTAVPYGQRNDA